MSDTDIRYRMREALLAAMPVMRRSALDYLCCASIGGDPETIPPMEWAEIAPNLDAIILAESCVGRISTGEGDDAWLDAILDAGEWRKHREATI